MFNCSLTIFPLLYKGALWELAPYLSCQLSLEPEPAFHMRKALHKYCWMNTTLCQALRPALFSFISHSLQISCTYKLSAAPRSSEPGSFCTKLFLTLDSTCTDLVSAVCQVLGISSYEYGYQEFSKIFRILSITLFWTLFRVTKTRQKKYIWMADSQDSWILILTHFLAEGN
jgi:hypothetical protein